MLWIMAKKHTFAVATTNFEHSCIEIVGLLIHTYTYNYIFAVLLLS